MLGVVLSLLMEKVKGRMSTTSTRRPRALVMQMLAHCQAKSHHLSKGVGPNSDWRVQIPDADRIRVYTVHRGWSVIEGHGKSSSYPRVEVERLLLQIYN